MNALNRMLSVERPKEARTKPLEVTLDYSCWIAWYHGYLRRC